MSRFSFIYLFANLALGKAKAASSINSALKSYDLFNDIENPSIFQRRQHSSPSLNLRLPTIDSDQESDEYESIEREQQQQQQHAIGIDSNVPRGTENGLRLALPSPLLQGDDEDEGPLLIDNLVARNGMQTIQNLVPSSSKGSSHDKKRFKSTGTTIAGICGKDWIVLGADTRATNQNLVADKMCSKIHYLAPHVYACGAGTSSDLDHVTEQARYSWKVQERLESSIGNVILQGNNNDSNGSAMAWICHWFQSLLYSNGGGLGVNIIVGGLLSESSNNPRQRPYLVAIHPHGSIEIVPFAALGSGGLAAMAVLEESCSGGSHDLTVNQAKEIVVRAIEAGIQNDLASGSQVDLCILRVGQDEAEYIRGAKPEQESASLAFSTMARNTGTSSSQQQNDQPGIDNDGGGGGGVNGFGNLPYQIASQRSFLATSKFARQQQKGTSFHDWLLAGNNKSNENSNS